MVTRKTEYLNLHLKLSSKRKACLIFDHCNQQKPTNHKKKKKKITFLIIRLRLLSATRGQDQPRRMDSCKDR